MGLREIRCECVNWFSWLRIVKFREILDTMMKLQIPWTRVVSCGDFNTIWVIILSYEYHLQDRNIIREVKLWRKLLFACILERLIRVLINRPKSWSLLCLDLEPCSEEAATDYNPIFSNPSQEIFIAWDRKKFRFLVILFLFSLVFKKNYPWNVQSKWVLLFRVIQAHTLVP
jgi:hypothetical protein